MNREEEKQEETERGPGRFRRLALRAVDACLNGLDVLHGRLQALRERFGGSPADRDERRGRHAAEPEATEAKASIPSRLLNFFLILLGFLITTGIGGIVAYQLLEIRIAQQAAAVERMREEADATSKENARQINLMARFQKESAEARQQAREAEREADDAIQRLEESQRRINELENQLAQRPGTTRSTGTTVRPKPKTGSCTVDANNPNASLTECINKFNRP